MMFRFRQWLSSLRLHDPIEQQQAPIVQIFLLGIVVGGPLAALAFAVTLDLVSGVRFTVLAGLLCAPFAVIALVLLRRDRFAPAILTMVAGFLLSFTIALVPLGARSGGPLYVAYLLPIVFTGLLLTRRTLLLVSVFCIAVVVMIAFLEPLFPVVIGFAPLPGSPVVPIAASFAIVVGLLGGLLDRFGGALRIALVAALTREQELEAARASLETTVAERTASLQDALRDVEQRETRLAQAFADLRASQDTIRELSAPVIPVLSGVLVAPMVGALDSARAAVLTENILSAVERERTSYVIFDITGVPIIDTLVTQAMIRTATAVQLLGAQVALVGVRPEVAQTMVALNISLGAITVYPDLQQAVETLLARSGWSRTAFMAAVPSSAA